MLQQKLQLFPLSPLPHTQLCPHCRNPGEMAACSGNGDRGSQLEKRNPTKTKGPHQSPLFVKSPFLNSHPSPAADSIPRPFLSAGTFSSNLFPPLFGTLSQPQPPDILFPPPPALEGIQFSLQPMIFPLLQVTLPPPLLPPPTPSLLSTRSGETMAMADSPSFLSTPGTGLFHFMPNTLSFQPQESSSATPCLCLLP